MPLVVQVMNFLVGRKALGRVEVIEIKVKKIANRMAVFSSIKPAKNGFTARALAIGVGVGDGTGEPSHDFLNLLGMGPRFFLGRHFAQIELIENILIIGQLLVIANRKNKLIKTAVGLLLIGTVTFLAVVF